MNMSAALQAAVSNWLAEGQGAGNRRQGSAALSATYRAGGSSKHIDLSSYLVARLPATYAAVSRVLGEAAALTPGFAPQSLLDAGSGPGTASWAAVDVWDSLRRVTLLDNAPDFLKLATTLAGHGPEPLRRAEALAGSIETLAPGQNADLVIAAYALAELPLNRISQAAANLWRAASSVLVLVEPGTPQGFARIRAARDALLPQGGVPAAPCTHAAACPIAGQDWCHFSVRLARSRAHMHAKGASVPFEDEKFAYLVLVRGGKTSGGARIIAPPQHGKPGSTFRLCADGRIEERHIARRQAELYRQAKKLNWGDVIGPAPQEEEA